MADGTTDPNEVLAEQIGPEGTIASIQANMPKIRAGSATDGFVEDKPATSGEEPPVKEEKLEDKKGAKEKKGAKPDDKPAEDKTGAEDTEFKPRFKNQEDAEKSHAEAERKMHEATTQAAKDKEAREAIESERDELKQKLEEALAKPPEKPAEETKPATGEDRKVRIKTATKAVFAKIAEMDRTDDDYNEQVADAWAEGLEAVGMGGTDLTQAEIDKMVKGSLKAEQEAEAATREEKRKKDEADEGARVEVKARELGSKAGLDLDDPESADSIIWDWVKTQIPKEVFDKGTLEAQVEWVTAEVHKRTGKVVSTSEAEKERARKAQLKNSVLPRGNNRPPDQESKPEEYSLASLQKADREKRAARHKGV